MFCGSDLNAPKIIEIILGKDGETINPVFIFIFFNVIHVVDTNKALI